MTTYTNIPDNEVDQDSPVTQPLVTALRDNPLAIAEGAVNAPRLYGKAAVPRQQQTELDVLTVSASDDYVWSNLMYSGAGFETTSTTSGFYQSAGSIVVVLATGTARFSAVVSLGGGPSSGGARLLKNGSQIASGGVSISVDVAVTPGDEFEFQVRSNGIGTAAVSGMQIKSTDAYQRIGIPIRGTDL